MVKAAILCGLMFLGLLGSAAAADDPASGPTAAGQSAADALKQFSSAEGALVPAGVIGNPLQNNELSTMLTSPSDRLVEVELTGAQLRTAFDRSLSLYPQPNVGFLQISGFEITFTKGTGQASHVTDVTLNGSKLEDSRSYDVAMPASLQRGQLGYSNLWDKAKIVRSFDKVDLGSVLHGKHVSQSAPRWQPH